MLSPSHRLPKQNVSDIMRFGLRVADDSLWLWYKKTTRAPRFSFIVSTKVDKRATQRNRMRRTVSESVRHLVARTKNADGIFVVRKNIAELSQSAVEKLVADVLMKAGLL